jgi:hypothetical protein
MAVGGQPQDSGYRPSCLVCTIHMYVLQHVAYAVSERIYRSQHPNPADLGQGSLQLQLHGGREREREMRGGCVAFDDVTQVRLEWDFDEPKRLRSLGRP